MPPVTIRIDMKKSRLAQFSIVAAMLAAGLAVSGCIALNQMSEGIADTMQEFGGKAPADKKSGDGAEAALKKLGPEHVLLTLNGIEPEAPAEEGAPFFMADPVALPTIFSYTLPDEDAFGGLDRAILQVTLLEDGVAKAPHRAIYSEKGGPNTALFPGAEIDLRTPDVETIKTIVGGYPFEYNHYYEAGKEYELEVRATGKKGASKKVVRFWTAE